MKNKIKPKDTVYKLLTLRGFWPQLRSVPSLTRHTE